MDRHEELINEIQFARKQIEDAPKDTPHELLDMWLQDLHMMSLELRDIHKACRV
ncbi:MAG: hypothetical protein E6767_19740 [Dysgonomonas sp.]|nr:hypothetical protein [Dysgonomonas sp.]